MRGFTAVLAVTLITATLTIFSQLNAAVETAGSGNFEPVISIPEYVAPAESQLVSVQPQAVQAEATGFAVQSGGCSGSLASVPVGFSGCSGSVPVSSSGCGGSGYSRRAGLFSNRPARRIVAAPVRLLGNGIKRRQTRRMARRSGCGGW